MMGILGSGGRAGIEVGQRRLRAAGLAAQRGRRQIGWVSEVELPQGLVLNSFTEPNITDFPAFVGSVLKLMGPSGYRGSRVNVALPDFVSRVSVFDFEMLPGRKEEAEQMIRWRLKKLLPIDVEEAALRYQYLGRFRAGDKDQHRFLVSIIKTDILDQYERAFREAGLKPAWIETASFAVWNLFEGFIKTQADAGQGFALMNVSGGRLTVIVFDHGVPRFLRLKDLGGFGGDEEGNGGVDVIRVLRELTASLTFYKENYAESGVDRIFLAGDMDGLGSVAEEIGRNSAMKADVLDVEKVLEKGPGAGAGPAGLLAFGAAFGAASEA